MNSNYKGIVLAGGSGTRLHPITKGISKQLLPVFDKPMIYYPISVLMLAGIREILVISSPDDIEGYRRLLGDGSDFGLLIDYVVQPSPDGLAQAFTLGEDFIGDSNVALVLGDNIFYGQHFTDNLKAAVAKCSGATIFGYHVKDPERFGVVEFADNGKVLSIEEKPIAPKSNYAITGLYFFPKNVSVRAKKLKPSKRGELEISDLNAGYLKDKKLRVKILNRGFTWLDTGTFDSLLEASNFISLIQNRQNTIVACPEEIAFMNGWIKKSDLIKISKSMKNSYSSYLEALLKK